MALPMLMLMGGQALLSMKQNADMADAQNALYAQNAEHAINAQTNENRGINERVRQEQDVAAQNKRKLLVDMISAQSTSKATGKALTGNSVDRLQQTISNQVGQMINDLNYNIEGMLRNAEMQKEGTNSKAQSRINSVQRADYDPTLDFLSAGLSIYGANEQMKFQKKAAGTV